MPTDSTDAVLETPISIPKKDSKQSVDGHSNKDCEAYRPLIEQYDWDVEIAFAVCSAESQGQETAVNWKDNHKVCMGSAGLFQIGCVNAPIEEMQIAENNIEKAYQLYGERGWQPWGAYTDGRYLNYL